MPTSPTTNAAGRLFFGFVLAGAFEAAGRLLHEKHGLARWDARPAGSRSATTGAGPAPYLIVVIVALGRELQKSAAPGGGHGGLLAFHGLPDYLVKVQIGHRILVGKVELG